jgi:hypothetical protein
MLVAGAMIMWTTGQDLPRDIEMLIMIPWIPLPPLLFLVIACLHINTLQALASDPHMEEPPSKTLLSVEKVPYINCEHVS